MAEQSVSTAAAPARGLARASVAELHAARARHERRIAAIDAGAPATPDSRVHAQHAADRISAELARRGAR